MVSVPGALLSEKLSRIKLVLMDIDGTLVSPGHTTFGNVLSQLRRLRPLGIAYSVATGRSIHGAKLITDQLRETGARLPPMINYNGAVVLSGEGGALFTAHTIPRSSFVSIVQYARQNDIGVTAYCCERSFEQGPLETVFRDRFVNLTDAEFNGMPIIVVDDLLALDREFVAVLLSVEPEKSPLHVTTELNATFGRDVRVTTSGGRFIEICNLLGTKQYAMAELARLKGVSVEEILAVGDNFNDLEMLKAAGVGAAVANAPAEVQAAATLTSSMPSGMGVVEILRLLTRAVRYARQDVKGN